jgi:hypothetical protein
MRVCRATELRSPTRTVIIATDRWAAYRRLGAALVGCALAVNPNHRQAIADLATDLGGAIVARDTLRAKLSLRGLVHLADDAPAVRVTAAGEMALAGQVTP